MEPKRFVRNPDVVFRLIGEEMLLVPIRSSIMELRCLFTLSETGAFIWEQLAEPRSIQEIHKAVVDEFEVSFDQAGKDLDRFISQLIKEKCIFEAHGGQDAS